MMMRRNCRVAIYTRVSTDGQTCANQENELRAVAERKGCSVVKVYTDTCGEGLEFHGVTEL
jgi:DNA invertase Pin-like site-specific DNA recombinase